VRRPLTRHVAVGAVRAADGDDDVNLNDEGSAGQDPRKMTGAELVQQDPRLAEVVRRLVAAYEPLWIYLFGSVARGEPGPDRDYDLMVIVSDGAPPDRRRSRLAYEALRGTGIAADVLVSTRSRFERRARVVASLPATVLREGKLVHAA